MANSRGIQEIRKWRAELKLSQREAAERIGLKRSSYIKFEQGVRRPGRAKGIQIEEATDGRVTPAMWDQPAQVVA